MPGKISIERAVRSRQHYVYTLSLPAPIITPVVSIIYPGTRMGKQYGRVFYVGKGYRARVFQHEYEAEDGCGCDKCKVIRGIWESHCTVELNIHLLTPRTEDAYLAEGKLIATIGLGNLTNKQGGNSHYMRQAEKLELFRKEQIDRAIEEYRNGEE